MDELIRGKRTYRGLSAAGSTRAAVAEEARGRRRRESSLRRCRPPEEPEAGGGAAASSAAEEARDRGIRWSRRPAEREASGIPEHRHQSPSPNAACSPLLGRAHVRFGAVEWRNPTVDRFRRKDASGWAFWASSYPAFSVSIWSSPSHVFFPCELLPQIGRCFQNVLPTTRAHVEDSASTERDGF
jgi:hypothetical protein